MAIQRIRRHYAGDDSIYIKEAEHLYDFMLEEPFKQDIASIEIDFMLSDIDDFDAAIKVLGYLKYFYELK